VNGVGMGHTNADSAGNVYTQEPSRTREIDPDPIHETKNVLRQIDGGNKGFVADYEMAYPQSSSLSARKSCPTIRWVSLPAA